MAKTAVFLCLVLISWNVDAETDTWSDISYRLNGLAKQHGDLKGLELTEVLGLNSSKVGVGSTEGLYKDRPAWKLRDQFQDVALPSEVMEGLRLALTNNISLYLVYKQQKRSVGTLFSLYLPGTISPLLSITSNTKTRQLLVHYRVLEDDKLHQTVLAYSSRGRQHNSKRRSWTQVAVSLGPRQVTWWKDCGHEIYRNLTKTVNLNLPRGTLGYFRQEPGRRKRFVGSIQVALVSPRQLTQRPWTCA